MDLCKLVDGVRRVFPKAALELSGRQANRSDIRGVGYVELRVQINAHSHASVRMELDDNPHLGEVLVSRMASELYNGA